MFQQGATPLPGCVPTTMTMRMQFVRVVLMVSATVAAAPQRKTTTTIAAQAPASTAPDDDIVAYYDAMEGGFFQCIEGPRDFIVGCLMPSDMYMYLTSKNPQLTNGSCADLAKSVTPASSPTPPAPFPIPHPMGAAYPYADTPTHAQCVHLPVRTPQELVLVR